MYKRKNTNVLQSDCFSGAAEKQILTSILKIGYLRFSEDIRLRHSTEVSFSESFRVVACNFTKKCISTGNIFLQFSGNFEDGSFKSYSSQISLALIRLRRHEKLVNSILKQYWSY